MLKLNPNDNTERENYQLLISTLIPTQIAFVTTQSDEGIVNGAPFSDFHIISSNPPMISISIQRTGGNIKDTARNIYENHEFVVQIVDVENVEKINKTAEILPASESELEIVNLTQVESTLFIAAGTNDPICTQQESVELQELLESAGASVSVHWENRGHQLTMTEVQTAKQWYQEVF